MPAARRNFFLGPTLTGVMRPRRRPASGLTSAFLLALLGWAPAASWGADPQLGPPLRIQRAAGEIAVDGELGDPGWQGVAAITTWFETNPGDNLEPSVKNVGYLTYDDRFFYAAFEFADPEPGRVRAPIGDHDAVPGSTDYGGVIVDTRDDGKTAQMFLANPRGTRYDAMTSDASGEDSSPDFYWDAAGKITASGWQMEIRIPFSSLRYSEADAPTWRIMLYRNHPRDRRFQYFTSRLPREVNCFICNSSKLTGLERLPRGSHVVAAPFVTGAQASAPESGLGSSLDSGDFESEIGLDVKWNPNADTTIDGTLNPDFSQVESDTAQISTNERFALFFPEKRPFFLESVDLLASPIQVVYTRALTSPKGGLRATGRFGATSYTALVAEDRGGGLVILPGPTGSGFADQDFESRVGLARLKHDLGSSFVGFIATAREIEGGGHNRVFGPDFEWRPRPSDSITGQFLWSDTRTPVLPQLAQEWDGRDLADHAALLWWSHGDGKYDWFVQLADFGEEFRADNGFVPQVGYREVFVNAGRTWHPKERFFSRVRLFTNDYEDRDHDGDVVSRRVSIGSGMDGRFNSFLRVELNDEDYRVGDRLLSRFRPRIQLQANPGWVFNQFSLTTTFGDEIDFANGREGDGFDLSLNATLRASERLEFRVAASRRQLDVDAGAAGSGRLFTAEVERLRGQFNFNSRAFVRLIAQYVETERDPALYTLPVTRKDAGFSGSALFAYKLNWQTVLYLGFSDGRTYLEDTDELEPSDRQLFLKLSYAWQR